MPPKSAKKDLKPFWLSCDKCGVKVIQSKMKLHENECGSKHVDGVLNEYFFTSSLNNSLPPEFDSKDVPTIYMQRFIFIPETICSLCNFQMGSNLLIEIKGKKFVRSSWTINDKYLDAVFSSSEGNIRNQSKFFYDHNFF